MWYWIIGIIVVLAFLVALYELGIEEEKEIDKKTNSRKRSKEKVPLKKLDTIRIQYKDRQGQFSERNIDVHSIIDQKGISGWCHLRKDVRTFFFDRIQNNELIRISTGEVVSINEWINWLFNKGLIKHKPKYTRQHTETQRKYPAKKYIPPLTNPTPEIIFEGKKFFLGGYFNCCDKPTAGNIIVGLGGKVQPKPNGRTDYIVINKSYGLHSTAYSQLETVWARGKEVNIISEDDWFLALSKLGLFDDLDD